MKEFTIMLLAAFVAIMAYAAGPKKQFSPELASMQLGTQFNGKQTPKALTKQAASTKLQAPVSKFRSMAEKNAVKAVKSKKDAKVFKTEETQNLMLVSEYYDFDDELGLIPASPKAGGTPITLAQVDEEEFVINGFTSYATEGIKAIITKEVFVWPQGHMKNLLYGWRV